MKAAIALLLVLVGGGFVVVAAVLSPDDCSQQVDIPDLPFPPSPLSCAVVWKQFNFILRHHYDDSSQRLSIVLSANFASNWFSMGFSPTGKMIGSSALVGYVSLVGGNGVINQYYLAGKTSDQLFVHQGNLTVVTNSGIVRLQNQTTYMAFQLQMSSSLAASSKVIYAYAYNGITPNASGYIEGPHQSDWEMSFNFVTGSSTSSTSPVSTLRTSHGIVNIFAWAWLATIGGFIARYLRHRGSFWFTLHIGFQTVSYIFGIAGVGLGIKLTKELPTAHWRYHRAVGIFVLFLATLQILAICARPHKDSKYRNTWNWYHFIVGRCTLFLAAVNIVVGFKIAHTGMPLKAGYAVTLVLMFIAFFILEALYWLRWKKKRQHPTGFSRFEMT